MKIRAINPKDYEKLLELDKKVYPTENSVTPKILDQWFQNNPEFGMIFEKNKRKYGICIAIPLNKKGWKSLIEGKLSEAELNEKTIFKNSRDKEIGIHIYHIEKLKPYKEFYKESLKGLAEIIKNLKKENSDLKVAGFSGLCVTSSGIGLFYNKLNCRERNFINTEHILSKKGKLEIFNSKSKKELSKKLKQGYKYLNRCKMLVIYPQEKSIVWDYLK